MIARARRRSSSGVLELIAHAAIWAAVGSVVRHLPLWVTIPALCIVAVLAAVVAQRGRA